MNEDDDDPDDSLVEDLARRMLVQPFFRQVLTGKAEQVADELEVDIPVLILLQQSRHEVLVTHQLHPRKCKVWVEDGVDLMELPCEDVVEGRDFVLVEVVLLASGVADEVEEEFEEGALVVSLALLGEASVEDLKDGLEGVLEEDVGVVACD